MNVRIMSMMEKRNTIAISVAILVLATIITLVMPVNLGAFAIIAPSLLATLAILYPSYLSLTGKENDPIQWSLFLGALILVLICSAIALNISGKPDISTDTRNILQYCWKEWGANYFSHKGDWIALIIAFFSFVFAVFTWKSQSDTQRNTQGITPQVQKGILVDYGRHNYRNLAVMCAIIHRLEQKYKHGDGEEATEALGYDLFYPSEDHILKLQTDDRSIYPEAFDHDEYACSELHKFKLNIRNGNIEIKAALTHLTDADLDADFKRGDMKKLMDRLDYIMKQTRSTISHLYNQTRAYTAFENRARLNEVISNDTHENQEKIDKALKKEKVKQHIYYSGLTTTPNGEIRQTDFVRAFFPDEKDLADDEKDESDDKKLRKQKDEKATWKIKTYTDLINYVNAEVDIMLEEKKIVFLPLKK